MFECRSLRKLLLSSLGLVAVGLQSSLAEPPETEDGQPAVQTSNSEPILLTPHGQIGFTDAAQAAAQVVVPADCAQCQCPKRGLGGLWQNQLKPCLQESHWGYPEFFCEEPFGASWAKHMHVMIDNGNAARMIMYNFDFVEGSDQLKFKGENRLAKIVGMMSKNTHPLIIESTPDPALAASRRMAIIARLQQIDASLSPDRIVVAASRTGALSSVEGEIILKNVDQQTLERGTELKEQGVSGGFVAQ